MTWIRPDLYKAISENDIASVEFSDPFSEDTRKAKRNVVVAAFVVLLIALLGLKVTGFLGLAATTGDLGNPVAEGVSCIIVAYLLVTFVAHAFIDYTAWKFERERLYVKPYLDLVAMLEGAASTASEQIANATTRLQDIRIEKSMQSQTEAERLLKESLGQLKSIDKHLDELLAEARPLYSAWAETLRSMSYLSARRFVRYISLWILDIAFPVALAALAISQTYTGLKCVVSQIAS